VGLDRIVAQRQAPAVPLDQSKGHVDHGELPASRLQLSRPHEWHLDGGRKLLLHAALLGRSIFRGGQIAWRRQCAAGQGQNVGSKEIAALPRSSRPRRPLRPSAQPPCAPAAPTLPVLRLAAGW
jgi:hypothetical protein